MEIIFLIILLLILLYFLSSKRKVHGVFINVVLRKITNLKSAIAQKGNKMDLYNCYPGFELFGTFQSKDGSEPRKGENFTALFDPAKCNVILGVPRDYTDPTDPEGNVGTEVDVQVQYVAEGDDTVTLKFDAIEGDPEAPVDFQFGVHNTTIATGGSFTPGLRPIV